MPALERSINLRGPRFFGGDGCLMFVNHLDASTRDGPREATKEDTLAHPEAWAAFVTEVEAEEAREAGQAEAFEREPIVHPLRPMITFDDPEDGKPPAVISQRAKARAAAKAEG